MGPKGRARAGGAVGTWYNSFYIVRVAQFRDGTGGSGRWRRNMVQQLNYIVRGAKFREGVCGIVNIVQQLLHSQGDKV